MQCHQEGKGKKWNVQAVCGRKTFKKMKRAEIKCKRRGKKAQGLSSLSSIASNWSVKLASMCSMS